MRMTCSCGAIGEFPDTMGGGVDASKWNDSHSICRLRLDLPHRPETKGTIPAEKLISVAWQLVTARGYNETWLSLTRPSDKNEWRPLYALVGDEDLGDL